VDVEVEAQVSTNSIVKTITDYADREEFDLVVMGTRGETEVAKMLLGSVASGVLNNLDKTIVVVK
jgi:nucleotide-binding universal stress UspA family protein